QIAQRVPQIERRIEFHFSLGSDPHIDVLIKVLNASVFELVMSGKIDGQTRYGGKPLAANPQVSHDTNLPGPTFLRLEHGESGTMKICQFVSTDMADQMW